MFHHARSPKRIFFPLGQIRPGNMISDDDYCSILRIYVILMNSFLFYFFFFLLTLIQNIFYKLICVNIIKDKVPYNNC